MADYNLFINAEIDEANKKLDKVDKKLESIDKKAGNLNLEFPDLDQVSAGLQTVGKGLKLVWDYSDTALGSLNRHVGAVGDLKEAFSYLVPEIGNLGRQLKILKKLMPTTIVGTGFDALTSSINNSAQSVARLGYVFFGLQQSIGLVQQTFNGFFNTTIRRQAELEATILKTKTTLASTARVLVDGLQINDPLAAIEALDKPIEETITNIRRRSLEIAGTTSEAIIQTFSVVSAQIGQIGGDLKDAEDLSISFAAALGTIGLSNPMYATQEIRSILTGNIDQNSVLARSLGITNEDVTKAKASAEGLVSWLENRLAAFGAGQKIAAKQLSGVLSNVLEVYEEFTREVGKPLLAPLLESITAVFDKLSGVFKQLLGFASALGTAFGEIARLAQNIVGSSDFNLISQEDIANALDGAGVLVIEFVESLMDKVYNYIRPMAVRILNSIKKLIDTLLPSIGQLVAAFAEFQLIKFEVAIDSFEYLVSIVEALSPALKGVLDLYAGLMASDWLQFLAQTVLYIEILEKSGVNAIARLVVQLAGSMAVYKKWFRGLKAAAASIKPTIQKIRNFIVAVIKGLEANVISLITSIIEIMANVGAIITTAVRVAALKIKAVLLEIAVLAQGTGTAIGSSIATGALAAAAAMDTLAAKSNAATTALMKVDANAANIAKNINPIGRLTKGVGELATAVKVKLATAFRAAGAAIKSAAIGIALFAAQMLAITVVMGLALQLWSKYSNGVQSTATINKGIRANERLKASLAGVNEESSLWMQRQKELAIAARQSGIEEINKQLDEAEEKAKKAREALDALAKKYKDKPKSQGFSLIDDQEDLSDIERNKLKKEVERYERLKKQADELAIEEAKEAQQKADKQTVQILGKERTALEEQLKKEREKIERSLADYKFRIEQGNQQKLQQGREAQFRVELARIQQAQEQARSGLTGVALEVANILDDYNNTLLTAEQERLKREFDLKQQVAKLGKDTADYQYKLEEQKAKLQKKAGDFNVKVANYQLEVARRANEERMQAELEAGKLRTKGYTNFGDSKDNFKNVASANDVSSTKLLAFLQAGGAEAYGITSDIPVQEVIDILKREFPKFSEALKAGSGDAAFMQILEQFTGEKAVADFAFAGAKAELGTNGLWERTLPAPPKMENLDFDIASYAKERRKLNDQILETERNLNATLNKVNADLASLKLDQLATRPDLLTSGLNITSAAERDRRINTAALRTRAFRQGGSTPNPFDYASQRRLLTLNRDQAVQGVNNNLALNPADSAKALNNIKKNFEQRLKELPEKLANAQQADSAEAQANLVGTIEALRSGGLENLRNTTLEASRALAELGVNSEKRLAQMAVETAVEQKRQEFIERGYTITAEVNALLGEYRDVLEATTAKQLALNEKLEPLIRRVALVKLAAETFAGAMRNAAGQLLNGQDPSAILDQFAATLTGAVTEGLLDYAFEGLEEQFESLLGEAFSLKTTEEEIKSLTQQFKDRTSTQLEEIKTSLTKIATAPSGMGGPNFGPNASDNDLIGQVVGELPGENAYATPGLDPLNVMQELPVQDFVEPVKELGTTMEYAGAAAVKSGIDLAAQTAANLDLGKSASSVQSAIAGATAVLAGIGMVANGINKMQEGGTYNTLAGLGQIFMGIGSAGLGISGFFAEGGRPTPHKLAVVGEEGPELWIPDTPGTVIPNNAYEAARSALSGGDSGSSEAFNAGVPYLIGERGPESVVPSSNAQVIPNHSVPFLNGGNGGESGGSNLSVPFSNNSSVSRIERSNRETVEAMANPGSLYVKFDSQVINSVEYVTAAQHREGMAQAAERGRSLTLSTMQNSVKTRRRVGI